MKRKINPFSFGYLLCCIAILYNCSTGYSQTAITLNTFSSPYNYPIGIFNCGDNRLFVMEQLGYVYICDLNGVKNTVPFLDIHVRVNQSLGERGLLGLAFHPSFSSNGYLYVNYINLAGNTVISRFSRSTSNVNRMDETTEFILMTITQPYANHNGGCLQFGKDGYLYIAQGDGGSAGDPGNRSQNDLDKLGKIMRIDINNGSPYSIPLTNPNYGSSFALPEIWAKGMRNPWRWSFDSYNGDMWIGDVGQNTYEEINYQPATSAGGINYGWRCYEANNAFNTSANCPTSTSLTFPVYQYVHGATSGCSVTGGYVYRGGINGELFGKYIFSDYCSGLMRMIEKTGTSSFVATQLNDQPDQEISSFGEDVNEELYVCYRGSGQIRKLTSNGCSPTAFVKGNATITACSGSTYNLQAIFGVGLIYQWYKNMVLIAGATSSNYNVSKGGTYKVIVTKAGGCSATSNAVKVNFSPTATITANGPTTFCAGSNVILSANAGSGFTYQWKRNGAVIFGATAINYTATQAANYKVTITNTSGCSKTSNIIATIVNCKLAEQFINEKLIIDVSPNPSSDFVNVSLQGLPNQQYKLSIYDMVGKRLSEFIIATDNDSNGKILINVSNYENGIYNLLINGINGNYYKKLIVN